LSELDNLFQSSFKFNKKFGQNFIFDNNLLNAIVADAEVDENTTVLEIGTGAGTLTRALAKKAKQVYTFEIDRELENYLTSAFDGYENIKLNFMDIMKLNLKEFEESLGGEKYVMVANLPYYITTPIIFKFLEEAKSLTAMYIMVQKEVADRICAKSGGKDYGVLTVSIQSVADVSIIKKVSRTMFMPVPNVDSAIVKIQINKEKLPSAFDLEKHFKVVADAFSMRRKTLENNLKKYNNENTNLNEVLKQCNIKQGARAESLTIEDFINLTLRLK